MYRPKYFSLWELVWETLANDVDRGVIPEKFIWRKFDDRFLITADALRKHFKETYYNTYRWNGNLQYCGARPPYCKQGANYSTHKDWNTGDKHIMAYRGLPEQDKIEAYKDAWLFIKKNRDKLFPYINVMEHYKWTPTWIHWSTANYDYDNKKLRIIKP